MFLKCMKWERMVWYCNIVWFSLARLLIHSLSSPQICSTGSISESVKKVRVPNLSSMSLVSVPEVVIKLYQSVINSADGVKHLRKKNSRNVYMYNLGDYLSLSLLLSSIYQLLRLA